MFFLIIGSGMVIIQTMVTQHAIEVHFWLGIGSWLAATIMLYNRFAKWASDPATAMVNSQGLTIHSEATGYNFAVSYAAVVACTYGTSKEVAWLRIDYPDGTKLFLRTFYAQKAFGKMATNCERYCKNYWLQIRLSQPRARR